MSRTIQQPITNTYSTQTVEVATATGFNAGDLVYYNNGDYKPPTSLSYTGSATFGYVNNAASAYGGTIGTESSPVLPATATNIGSSYHKFAAVLTSGNIVQAWINKGNQYPVFRIVDTSGTVLYGPTTIASRVIGTPNISVVALTGGGFAVGYQANSGVVYYAVYTNTGTVTAAETSWNAATPSSPGFIGMQPLPNGGFVIYFGNNSDNYVYWRTVTSTGSTTATSDSSGSGSTMQSYLNPIACSVRSDSSLAFFYWNASVNGIVYINTNTSGAYSSSGTAITSITAVSGPNGGDYNIDATILSNGTTTVIVINQATGVRYVTYTGTSTFSSLTTLIPVANIVAGSTAGPCGSLTIKSLSNSTFVVFCSDYSYTTQYAFFNEAFVCLSGTNSSGVVPGILPQVNSHDKHQLNVIELTSTIAIYWHPVNIANIGYNQYTAQINKTTYIPVINNTGSFSTPLITITAASSGVNMGSTSPTNLGVYAGLTSTLVGTAGATVLINPTAITSSTVDALASTTLPNGTFLIAYRNSISYVVSVAVYSAAGVLQQTIGVGTGVASSTGATNVKIAAMSSGKFVVAYATATTTITTVVYSSASSPSILGTATFTCNSITNANNFAVSGLAGDKYVIVYSPTSSTASYAVYNNTNTVVVATTTILSTSSSSFSCSGDPAGNFAVVFFDITNTRISPYYYNYNGSTYTALTYSTTSIAACLQTNVAFNSAGIFQAAYADNSSTAVRVEINNPPTTNTYSSRAVPSDPRTNSFFGLGLTGNGSYTLAYFTGATTLKIEALPLYGGNGTTVYIGFPGTSSVSINNVSYLSTGARASVCVTQGLGYNSVVAWITSNGIPFFTIVSVQPFSPRFNLTSDVTQSLLGPSINPINSSISSSIPNTVLAGVAATTATAGSTGQLIINGIAQLNSSYPSTGYGAFDYTGLPIGGVKGVYNGRTVTLQGNT